TLPARGATAQVTHDVVYLVISIHAPREGSDQNASLIITRVAYFNPRSPRGERLPILVKGLAECPFQSTLPARGATTDVTPVGLCVRISIHAPREGSDLGCAGQ